MNVIGFNMGIISNKKLRNSDLYDLIGFYPTYHRGTNGGKSGNGTEVTRTIRGATALRSSQEGADGAHSTSVNGETDHDEAEGGSEGRS
jgi:hypothetical protein